MSNSLFVEEEIEVLTEPNIEELLNSLTGPSWVKNKIINGKEVSFYNPEFKIAIQYSILEESHEFSVIKRERQYHHSKMVACEQEGIRLITIFQDEFLHKNIQITNFLRSVFNVYTTKIFARKTIFKEITKEVSKAFLLKEHIQSFATLSKHWFGLYHNTELVAVMTFGYHHRAGFNDIILDRFAIKHSYQIPGGAHKLFSNALPFLPNRQVKSWSDNRWSQGNVYSKIGFTLSNTLPPDYSYVPLDNPNLIRVSKQSQKKDNTDCPSNLTEKEWCIQRNLFRTWDCGKKVWTFQNTIGYAEDSSVHLTKSK